MTWERIVCKKFLVTVFLILVFLAMGVMVAWAQPLSGRVDMKVSGGYGDVARVGSQVPFRISISNGGGNIDGEIQVLADLNSQSRVIYAMPVSLPSGAGKEVLMYVPLSTANRKVEVRLVRGKKTLKTVTYSFQKLLSPENPTIAILSDDIEAMRELNEMKLPESLNFSQDGRLTDMAMKRAVAVAAGEKIAVADLPSEVFRLDKNMVPDQEKYFDGFDILIVSNFDTSVLTEKQINMLGEWMAKGNMIFIGTGPNTGKVYSGLPDSLKLLKKDADSTIQIPESLGKFIEKAAPAGSLDIITGNADSASVLLEADGKPIAVSKGYGKGCLTVLAFDPTLSPVAGWENAGVFWQKLITEAYNREISSNAGQQNASTFRSISMNYENLASQVPETQTPPFTALLILIGIYILIAGPLVYLFLKWKDKRDLNWLVIPAVAVVFLGIIYAAGFKTRYTKAVLNNFSTINIDNTGGKAYINTVMGVFNNKRSNMKLQYAKDDGFDINPAYNYYDYYSYRSYSTTDNTKTTIIGKMTLSDPCIYDLYDVGMWEPRYVYASKTKDIAGGIISSINISGGNFKAVVRNTTGFDFRDAFIVLGNSFINVGNIFPGDEKQINVSLSDTSISKRFEDFLDARYGSNYNLTSTRKSPDWRENTRKRNMLENFYNNISNLYIGSSGRIDMMFIALDFDDPQYSLNVNGDDPQKFNSNVIYSSIDMKPEKGANVEIPSGLILPSLEASDTAFYDGSFNNGVRVQADGDVFFRFAIPDTIDIGGFKINWSTFTPTYLKYQQQQKNSQVQQTYGKDKYEFSILNFKTGQWEKFEDHFSTESNLNDYIDDMRVIRLKSTVTLDKSGTQALLLGLPEIELKGVAK